MSLNSRLTAIERKADRIERPMREDKWKIERNPAYTSNLRIMGDLIPESGGGASELQGVLITTDTGCDMDNKTIAVVVREWDAQAVVDAHNAAVRKGGA